MRKSFYLARAQPPGVLDARGKPVPPLWLWGRLGHPLNGVEVRHEGVTYRVDDEATAETNPSYQYGQIELDPCVEQHLMVWAIAQQAAQQAVEEHEKRKHAAGD